jgi:sugar lactone lactonase YvrE
MKRLILPVLLAGVTAWAQTGPFGIATVAGSPYDPSGDNGPAKLAYVGLTAVAFQNGYLYLSDGARVRRVGPNGIITTVVGLIDPVVHQPIPGFSGDGGPALSAQLKNITSLAFDTTGNLYMADISANCIRKVTARSLGGVAQPLDGTEIISTFAGPATSATLNAPRAIAINPATGAAYIADATNVNVRMVDASGKISTIAGTGVKTFATGSNLGDGGPATHATFTLPYGVAVDPATGTVYVADVTGTRVRAINAAGIISTAAGDGTNSLNGGLNEGGQATMANVYPVKVQFANGILYILDGAGLVRQVSASGIITTIAGIGTAAYTGAFPPVGDGGPALAAKLGSGPSGVTDAVRDTAGDFFIADPSTLSVRFVASATAAATIFGQTVPAGQITTIVGPPGIPTFGGDNGPALAARFFGPGISAWDPASGSLYFADSSNFRVRRMDANRTITTVAGNGVSGYSGVPGVATAASLQPGYVAFSSGNLYVTSGNVHLLDVVGTNISLFANVSGTLSPPSGGPAASAHLGAAAIVTDPAGNVYIGDGNNLLIWKVSNGIATVIAGGTTDQAGAITRGTVVLGGITLSIPATSAKLAGPNRLALDPDGNLYTVDGPNNRILKIAAHSPNQPLDGTETVTVFAGTGTFGFSGDGGPAIAANLNGPGAMIFDAAGNLYFTDGNNFRVRKIDATGIITTIAGNGTASFSGDGGAALLAQIRGGGLAFDNFGNLFMTDTTNQVVRVLDNTPPTITLQAPTPAANANGWNNTNVSIPFTASDTGAGVASTIPPASPIVLSTEGSAVSGVVTATDRAGIIATRTSPAVRIDKTAPVISGMPAAGCSLWPPNGKMVQVATVSAADALSGLAPGSLQVSGTSNEPSGAAEISITPDGSGGYVVQLQANRLGTGTGRVYTITATASDLAGNSDTRTATCTVPHDQGH